MSGKQKMPLRPPREEPQMNEKEAPGFTRVLWPLLLLVAGEVDTQTHTLTTSVTEA